mmetsp:Transcript_58940/g.144175  ORF Transcript_58940/g.144175 Transcript_58940/m.144175 type:complete len:114 (+) Transcript_58940:739-1080(+)
MLERIHACQRLFPKSPWVLTRQTDLLPSSIPFLHIDTRLSYILSIKSIDRTSSRRLEGAERARIFIILYATRVQIYSTLSTTSTTTPKAIQHLGGNLPNQTNKKKKRSVNASN